MTDMSLYQKLAEGIGFGSSERIQKMFAMIADEDEAKFLLAAAPPATVKEIAERAGIPLEKAEKMARPLFKKGLLYKSSKPGPQKYYKLKGFVQFHDGTVLTPGVSQEYLDMWKEFEEVEMPEYRKISRESGSPPGMRVIPVNVAVESKQQIMASEDVVKMIEQAQDIAVTNCSCRTIHPDPDVPLEVCMQLDKAARYAVDRGTGRALTKEEAIAMLKMCEEKGLIHTVFNTEELSHAICNCDGKICGNWPDKKYAKFSCAPSRFLAEIDEETCSSCEICIDRCFFDAISMDGDDGTAVVNEENCMGCGLCVVTCPEEAIQMKQSGKEDNIPVK